MASQFSPKTVEFSRRSKMLEETYGITASNYNDMFEAQGGCCALCHVHQIELKSKLAVDHNHSTNEIRGLLCGKCNMALGVLESSSPRWLEAAWNYMKHPPARGFGFEIPKWCRLFRRGDAPISYFERLDAKRERDASVEVEPA